MWHVTTTAFIFLAIKRNEKQRDRYPSIWELITYHPTLQPLFLPNLSNCVLYSWIGVNILATACFLNKPYCCKEIYIGWRRKEKTTKEKLARFVRLGVWPGKKHRNLERMTYTCVNARFLSIKRAKCWTLCLMNVRSKLWLGLA